MKSKIKAQFIIAFLVSLVAMVVIALVFIQIQYSVNKKIASSLAKNTAEIISHTLDVAISEIEELSIDIITNAEVQSYRPALPGTSENLDRLQKFSDLFASYQIFKPYIETFYLRFGDGASLTIGDVQPLFSEAFLESSEEEIGALNGKLAINSYPGKPDSFLAMREIRKIKNLDHSHIAILYAVVNLDKLLTEYFNKYGIHDPRLLLQQDKQTIYGFGGGIPAEYISKIVGRTPGVYRIGLEYLYLNSAEIKSAPWKVYILLPFSEIISLRNRLIYGSIIGLLAGFVVLLVVGWNWSKKITKPIIQLADKMKELRDTDFSNRSYKLPEYEKNGDEIAVLYNNFGRLLKKIDFLIHENYRKQLTIKESRLRNLMAQINPHFMYNTLDTIAWMAQKNDTRLVADIVRSLGMLLRASVSSENIIPMEDEIRLLEGYLKIQKARFHDRLDYSIENEAVNADISVPVLMLQPLAENSIKYSLDIPKASVKILINIKAENGFALFCIRDNGPGIAPEKLESVLGDKKKESIGLGNISDRLNIFYGKKARISIESSLGNGTAVTIRVPLSSRGNRDVKI